MFSRGIERDYVVDEDIRWHKGKKNSGDILVVPKGFEFESSVPRRLRWLWSPDNPHYLLAAAIHDYMLEDGYRPHVADAEWYSAALSVRAPRWRTKLGHFAMKLRRLFNSCSF